MQPISVDSFSKNCAKYTGKYLCWSLFLMKFQALRPANLLKNDPSRGGFRCTLCSFSKNYVHKNWLHKTILGLFFFQKKFLRTPILQSICKLLLLNQLILSVYFPF